MKKYKTIGGPLKSVDDIVIPKPTERQLQLKAEYDALKQHLLFGTAYLFGRLAHERENKK